MKLIRPTPIHSGGIKSPTTLDGGIFSGFTFNKDNKILLPKPQLSAFTPFKSEDGVPEFNFAVYAKAIEDR